MLNGEYLYKYDDLNIPGRGGGLRLWHKYRSQRNFNGRWGYGWRLNYDIKLKKLENGNLLFINRNCGKSEYTKNGTVYDPPLGRYDSIKENGDGTYTQASTHGVTRDFDINGALTRITDRNGNATTFTYYNDDKQPITGHSEFFVNQTSGIIAYDYKLIRIMDSAGRTVRLEYNSNGRLSKIIDPAFRATEYEYDDNDNLIKITDPIGNFYTFTYDDRHNITAVTDPKSNTFVQNVYGNDPEIAQTYNRVTEHTYNGQLMTFSYSEDPAELTTTATYPDGRVNSFEMNENGNPVEVIRDVGGLNAVTKLTYD